MRPGHTANSCRANPPKSTIKVARRDSRSTFRSPVCGHRPFQLSEKLWTDGVDRIDQRRHGGTRRGAEEPAHGILCTSALHLLPRDLGTIDERLAVPLALDQSLAVKPIDDLADGRIDQALRLTQHTVHVANGRRAEFPELGENDVFQRVCRQLKRAHRDIVNATCGSVQTPAGRWRSMTIRTRRTDMLYTIAM